MTPDASRVVRIIRDLALVVVGGALLGYVVVRAGSLAWLDQSARVMPELHDNAVTNALATGVTAFGEESTLIVCFLGLILYAYLTRGRLWGQFFVTVAVGALALDNLIKPLVGRLRPEFEQLVPGRGYSFPSGHVLGTTALLFAIAYFTASRGNGLNRRALWTMAVIGSGLMALSRVYVGVHWPSDVIAGVMMGGAWTLLCLRSLAREPEGALLMRPQLAERALKDT